MAIFDSHSVRYLTYYIVLDDVARVIELQGQFPDGYQFAPYDPALPGGAAIAFNGSWSGTTDAPIAPFTNYVWSPEWTAENAYPQDVATFERHSGGIWGIGGDTVRYYWVGRFVPSATATPTVDGVAPPITASIPKRRWVEGFELGAIGPYESGFAGANGMNPSRDASRHVGGLGLAIRGAVISPAVELTLAKYAVGYTSNTSWERMYLRCRQVDLTQDVAFWETFAVESGNVGVQLRIVAGTTGWQLAVYKKQAGFYTFKQTIGTFDVWDGSDLSWSGFYKIDLLIKYSAAGSGGSLRVYTNGVLTATINFSTVELGLGSDGYHHRGSGFGNAQAVANTMHLDVDDWMNAQIPMNGAAELLTSPDWLAGTKIALLRPTAYGAAHDAVAWTGDFRRLMQNQLNTSTPAATVITSTSGAIMEVATDSDLVVDGDGALGCAALQVSISSTSVGATDGALRPTTLPANTGVSPATIDQSVAIAANEVLATVDGTINTFPDWGAIKLKFTKAADVNAVTVSLLMAQVELSGAWREEDYRLAEMGATPPAFPRWKGQHNAPYPRSPWAKDSLSGPESPYIVFSGTYVGNNTAQDLQFKSPIHFFVTRPATGDTGGHWWFSTMHAGHKDSEQSIRAEVVNVDQDDTFLPTSDPDTQQHRYRLRITGTHAQINATGVTYHYIAVSDPGGRFLLNCDANCKSTEVAVPYNLVNPDFLAEWIFIRGETWGGTSAGRPLIKGPGNTAEGVSSYTAAAALATALGVAAGVLTLKANLLAISALWGQRYSLWRRSDGNDDPGEPGVMAITSWTGDGTASRTIALAPASGKRPIFAIATGDQSVGGYMRDAMHTTNTSSRYDGTSVTTGITGGGIDSVSVGALLNVNGTAYSMLVLFGDATAGNGGFGGDGTFAPVQADAPADGPWDAVPDPAIFEPEPETSAPLIDEPDLDEATDLTDITTDVGGLVGGNPCEVYTRHAVNMALSRIGVSTRIENVATDDSEEAVLARSHILEDVNTTLRAFDWPFAKRYADLVLVDGSDDDPVNADWTFSYRAPNAMMKARRIVNQDGSQRGFDPNPPKFETSSDDDGLLIYTNEEATDDDPLVLEYTVRVLCPAFYGDALFRDALAWKFAESLAPVLAKDTKKQDYCRARFENAIARAKVPAAQEQQQAKGGDADWIRDR